MSLSPSLTWSRRGPACYISCGVRVLAEEIRLDFICVSCLGFLLRTARRRPISSTLPILLGLRGYVNKELNSLGLVSIPVGIPSLDRALIGVRVRELLSATWIESTTCKYL